MEDNSTKPIKKCSRCGTVIENNNAKFCSNCGNMFVYPKNKIGKPSVFERFISTVFCFLGGIALLASIFIFFMTNKTESKKEKIEIATDNAETVKTELDIYKDSVATKIAKETGLTFENVKFFEKKMGGLMIGSIETGHVPVNIFQSGPSCNIRLINVSDQTVIWDYKRFGHIKWRVIVDDTYVCPSHGLGQEPGSDDPIYPKQTVIISCQNVYSDNLVKNVQLDKSKIVIEILQNNRSILKLPIKNKLISMGHVL